MTVVRFFGEFHTCLGEGKHYAQGHEIQRQRNGHYGLSTLPGTYLDDYSIKAQMRAGYIDARDGRHLAYALHVNDAGPVTDIADVLDVIKDEGAI